MPTAAAAYPKPPGTPDLSMLCVTTVTNVPPAELLPITILKGDHTPATPASAVIVPTPRGSVLQVQPTARGPAPGALTVLPVTAATPGPVGFVQGPSPGQSDITPVVIRPSVPPPEQPRFAATTPPAGAESHPSAPIAPVFPPVEAELPPAGALVIPQPARSQPVASPGPAFLLSQGESLSQSCCCSVLP